MRIPYSVCATVLILACFRELMTDALPTDDISKLHRLKRTIGLGAGSGGGIKFGSNGLLGLLLGGLELGGGAGIGTGLGPGSVGYGAGGGSGTSASGYGYGAGYGGGGVGSVTGTNGYGYDVGYDPRYGGGAFGYGNYQGYGNGYGNPEGYSSPCGGVDSGYVYR